LAETVDENDDFGSIHFNQFSAAALIEKKRTDWKFKISLFGQVRSCWRHFSSFFSLIIDLLVLVLPSRCCRR
jgi:hypothetical protein